MFLRKKRLKEIIRREIKDQPRKDARRAMVKKRIAELEHESFLGREREHLEKMIEPLGLCMNFSAATKTFSELKQEIFKSSWDLQEIHSELRELKFELQDLA